MIIFLVLFCAWSWITVARPRFGNQWKFRDLLDEEGAVNQNAYDLRARRMNLWLAIPSTFAVVVMTVVLVTK